MSQSSAVIIITRILCRRQNVEPRN